VEKNSSEVVISRENSVLEISGSQEGLGLLAKNIKWDMTSPMHEGYQVWNRWQFHPYETGRHFGGEFFGISNFRMGLAVGATLALYKYTFGQEGLRRATGYRPGTQNDPSVRAIEAQYSLPGSSPSEEGEALYEYRRGLQEGMNFDWSRERGRRGPQAK